MKVDLKDTTFIIPVKIESHDRMRNVITILCFLLDNFDTKVILKEVDTESVFKSEVLPQIEGYVEDSIQNLTHVFEQSDDPVFYRMRYLNEMLAMCDTKVVANYDCDVLLPTSSYLMSQEMVLNGCDLVYPYGQGEWQKQIFADDEMVSDFLSNDCDFKILETNMNLYDAQFGHVQFFDRDSYIKGGMENENFRGSSPEDKERYYRFKKLGYDVCRLDDYVYHLEHSRGRNSWPESVKGNPYMSENFALWEKLEKMSDEEIKTYYSSQKYIEKYTI